MLIPRKLNTQVITNRGVAPPAIVLNDKGILQMPCHPNLPTVKTIQKTSLLGHGSEVYKKYRCLVMAAKSLHFCSNNFGSLLLIVFLDLLVLDDMQSDYNDCPHWKTYQPKNGGAVCVSKRFDKCHWEFLFRPKIAFDFPSIRSFASYFFYLMATACEQTHGEPASDDDQEDTQPPLVFQNHADSINQSAAKQPN